MHTLLVFTRGSLTFFGARHSITPTLGVTTITLDHPPETEELIGRRFTHVVYDGVTPEEVAATIPTLWDEINCRATPARHLIQEL